MLQLTVAGEPCMVAALGRARKEPCLMLGRDAKDRLAGRELSRADSRPMVSCAEESVTSSDEQNLSIF